MSRPLSWVVLVFMYAVSVPVAHGQPGQVRGTVTDADKQPVPGVNLSYKVTW